METVSDIASSILNQFQKPTLAFLIGGMVLAAARSRLEVPDAIYKFIVALLLLKVGMSAGMSVRSADPMALLVPAVLAIAVGIGIVLLGTVTLTRIRGVAPIDGYATAGLFGAVSASTLAAGMAVLETEGIAYEGFIGALYPFMDVAALITAIVMGRMATARRATSAAGASADGTMVLGGGPSAAPGHPGEPGLLKTILLDTVRSPAISALFLGLAIGLLSKPESVYQSFYEPLFRGLLSILMLIMGMEAWARLSELRKVAHAYLVYGLSAPIIHGLVGFGAGLIAHHLTGFSPGGVILLAVMAGSSSDISGPPTLRGALPEANPSAYVGTSTGVGTPIAILAIPLWVALADLTIGLG